MYIDDIATVTVDLPGNAERVKEAVPLAIHAIGRPQAEKEHLPREHLISLTKLEAEGSPSELIAMLGLTINTRSLLVSLIASPLYPRTDTNDDTAINTFVTERSRLARITSDEVR